jgi:hypothetical protein
MSRLWLSRASRRLVFDAFRRARALRGRLVDRAGRPALAFRLGLAPGNDVFEILADGGGLPFQAPDTRRLEQRILSRRPPESLGARCTPGVAAVIGRRYLVVRSSEV